MRWHDLRRRTMSRLMDILAAGTVLLALVPVAMILFFVIAKGAGSINLDFFTHMPKPVGETGGGMANAIVGSLIICGLGASFAIPVGVLSGVYIAESGGSRVAAVVRFAADTLNGMPSIIVGVFAYTLVVIPVGHFSALSGGVAVGIMMMPIITRTTEELLRLVPNALREGALALGATRARTILTVVIPAALPGIITGIVLAFARIAGETAPLVFTAFNSPYWSTNLMQPMASLTVQVYTYALTAYDDWHRQAWAGALVLVSIVLFCSILSRLATRRLKRMTIGH